MEKIFIRNIKKEDIIDIVDIQINGWQTAYKGIIDDDFLNSMSRDEKIEQKTKDYKKDKYIVAEINKEIVGFCRYIDNNKYNLDMAEINCEIIALYVKQKFKYNGIGTYMFQFVIDQFKSQNKTKMIVWCLKDNEPAKLFYKKMGGTIVKEKLAKIGDKEYLEVGFKYNI